MLPRGMSKRRNICLNSYFKKCGQNIQSLEHSLEILKINTHITLLKYDQQWQ